MHLHTLTLQALGPFAGRHTIDFAELSASGIFLLEGPTGAGKSTIIDAVVFALYGKVASKDASEDRLRSGHAKPQDETFVDLVLECGSGIYRVRRTPRFERPKKHGSGTTTQQASVTLWRLGSADAPDDGEVMSTRLDEAGLELTRIIGLDRSQFVQTVVLPQGEFASFLRANPEDRRGLLQKVFGTAVYDQLQQRLERMRAEVGRSVEDARHALVGAGSRFVGAADLDLEAAEAVRSADPRSLLPVVQTRSDEIAARSQTAQALAVSAADARAAAQQRLDQARALSASLDRRRRLRAELEMLAERAPVHAAELGRVADAQRAGSVMPVVLGLEQSEQTLRSADHAAEHARALVPDDVLGLVDERDEPGVQRKSLTVERDRCTSVRATLARLVEIEAGLPARRGQVTAAERARQGRAQERDRLIGRQHERPALRDALTTRLADATLVAATLAVAEQRAVLRQETVAAAEEVLGITVQVDRSKAAVTAAAGSAQAAVQRATELHLARIAGIAGELAAGLRPGLPCGVCGGTEHPAPAAPDPQHVSTLDVDAAEQARSVADRALADASNALATVRERLAARRTACGGMDPATARAQLDAALADVGTGQHAVVQCGELERELAQFEVSTRQLDEHIATLGAELAAQDASFAALRGQIARDEAEVADARDGAGSVGHRVSALDLRLGWVTDWADGLAALDHAKAQLAVRSAELASCLAEHRFDDVAAVRAARLDAMTLSGLEQGIAQHGGALARVEAGLAEPEIRALDDVPPETVVDVDGAALACENAQTLATTTGAEAARLAQRARSTALALASVEQTWTAYQAVQVDAGPVIRMANLAAANGGDNAKQLTLATYVLMRRFEDVVAAANSRLVTMSSGRFELVRSDEREDVRTRKTGLAMKVMDHHTGVDRDPRTLSGGETFYFSLCLALGLADVVTAEAGGVDLGTLFVDEGFGSLDAETLDVVLAELGRLRDGGRTVGVVSHVEAMKQSIAERIEVRPLPDGSSTLTVRA